MVMFLHLSVPWIHKCKNDKQVSPQKDNANTYYHF